MIRKIEALNEWEALMEEAKAEAEAIRDSIKQEMLNPLAQQFQEAVKAHRKDLKQDVDGILNGRMFFARQALEHGLIDQVGTVETATELVRQLSASAALEQYAATL